MAVRTKVLAEAAATSTPTVIYTCPAGETAIIKSLSLAKTASGTVSMDLVALRGATARIVLREVFPVTSTVVYREVWIVLGPGDQLRAATDAGTVSLWISGTELAGVAT